MMRRKLCNALAAMASLLIVFPVVFMSLDRQPPIVLTNGNITQTVESGSSATISWSVKKYREFGDGLFDCQGSFIRRIIDSGGFVIDTKPQTIISYQLIGEDNTKGTFSKDITLPIMLPGPALYQVITTYWCNPIQKYIWPITKREESVHFVVNDLTTGPPGKTGEQGPKGDPGKPAGQGR